MVGERSGVPEGDVRLGSVMSDVTRKGRMEEEDVRIQCWTLLLLLQPQANNELLTQLSVHWCICESVCLETPASAWDTGSADITRSALSLQVCQGYLL